MKFKKSILSLSVLSALTGISACQTSGQSSGINQTDAQETVRGRITGFGSIYVNGVEYETDSASIMVDGQPASEDDLKLGMIVTVSGNSQGNNGQALSVNYDDDLEGIITMVDVDANGVGSLTIMGHNITTDANTVIEYKVAGMQSLTDSVYDPAMGMLYVAEVSGHSDGSGNILATRIEIKAFSQKTGALEVTGRITELDQEAMTFTVGNMAVIYTVDTRLDDITGNMLQNDMLVEVEGTRLDDLGRLVATDIEREDSHDLLVDSSTDVNMEGRVNTSEESSFELDDQTFYIDDDTKGADLLQAGNMVQVEAHVDDDDNLVAESISVDEHDAPHGNTSELSGQIQLIDTDNNTLTLMGQVIRVTNNTIKSDDYSDIRYFSLEDINLAQTAQCAEVAVSTGTDGGLTATRLEYKGHCENTRSEIEGILENNSGVYSVAGINLDLSTMAAPAKGLRVEFEGNYIDGIFYADSLETEDNDS